MFNGYKSLNVTNLNVLTDNEDRTLRRSSPLGDRFGTFEARFIGCHLGYSCSPSDFLLQPTFSQLGFQAIFQTEM
jgi:hypothetical protein